MTNIFWIHTLADGVIDGDVELANIPAPAVAVAELSTGKEETGEKKDVDKKSFSIANYLGFNFDEVIEEGYEVPKKSYLELFLIFLWFGCRAFGGPGNPCTESWLYIFCCIL